MRKIRNHRFFFWALNDDKSTCWHQSEAGYAPAGCTLLWCYLWQVSLLSALVVLHKETLGTAYCVLKTISESMEWRQNIITQATPTKLLAIEAKARNSPAAVRWWAQANQKTMSHEKEMIYLHKHGHRHWSHSSRYRCDKSSFLIGWSIVDISNHPFTARHRLVFRKWPQKDRMMT